jgi:hypothetical protein
MTHGARNTTLSPRSSRGKPANLPPPGTRFARWTVLDRVEYRAQGDRSRPYVECRCACGTVGFVNVRNLRQGQSKSCGCLHRQRASAANVTHRQTGQRQTGQRLYRIWKQMHQRCYNPNCRSYRWYGAKGIKVCNAWHSFENFQAWALKFGYFPKAEIDRQNSSRGYSPQNCQWVTKQENLINKQNLLPVHLEREINRLASDEGVPAVTLIRRAVETYVKSPALRRKRVTAR